MTQKPSQLLKCTDAGRKLGPSARGLTLTELLVTLALLSALAAGVFPAAQALLSRGATQDVQRGLQTSWQMGQTMALAQQRPVIWELSNESTQARVVIRRDSRLPPDWSLTLQNVHIQARRQGETLFSDQAQVLVYSHGLTDPVELEATASGQTFKITLGGTGEHP